MHDRDWDRNVIAQLYREYRLVLSQHKVSLRPVAIQLFDSRVTWGQWDPLSRTILISRRLIQDYAWFYVQGILRHEMAHQWVHDVCGPESAQQPPHGEWFQLACRYLGVTNEFCRASVRLQETELDWRKENRVESASKLLEKVQKLLALATSSNEHEALLAMEKVRELYAKYQLEKATQNDQTQFVHLPIFTEKKRFEAFQDRILSILVGHFFVEVITSRLFNAQHNDYFKMIELVGTRENVLMAEYVYYFLMQQSDFWVRETIKQSNTPISRLDRKSLKLGILEGFSEKLSRSERKSSTPPPFRQGSAPGESTAISVIGTALTRFKNDPALKGYLAKVYPRLSYRSGAEQSIDPSYYQRGKSIGQSITLSRAVTTQGVDQVRLISKSSSM